MKMIIRWNSTGMTALAVLLVGMTGWAPFASAETESVNGEEPKPAISLHFREAPLEQVLQFYAELTDRTPIRAPGIDAQITLRSQTRLTRTEALHAIETALALHNVSLLPLGDRFIKVVSLSAARQEGIPIRTTLPEIPFPPADTPVSQVIELQHIPLVEVQPIVQGLLRETGHIQPLERAGAFLVTDTAANVRRVLDMLEYLDRPGISRTEIRIYDLHSARAADVAARIQELISDPAQESAARAARQQTTGRTQQASAIQARIQALERQSAAADARESRAAQARAERALEQARRQLSMVSDAEDPGMEAERGLVRGAVKIVPDERTNTLIVVTEPPNFVFFDRIVEVLDRAMEPEITLRVRHLEYAAAEEVAEILNAFLGAGNGAPLRTAPAEVEGEGARGRMLRDFLRAREVAETVQSTPAQARIGELSAETRILHDQRSNAVLIMGRRGDIRTLESVIDELDVMLAQVLIEAVIIEVSLGDDLSYGVDWLQRSLTVSRDGRDAAGDPAGFGDPTVGFGGGFAGGGNRAFRDGGDVSRDTPLGAGALTYYLTFYELNLDTILQAAASTSDVRVLSTPVILTTDNTEAKIIAGQERPVVTSTSLTTGGVQTSQYQYRPIGVELTVTPRINPQRVVVMDITQLADNVGDMVVIDGNEVPVITKRELSASVSVPSHSTIVLGGLVDSTNRVSETKVPLLGDIPILGTLFRSRTRREQRTELLVLITPYVMQTPGEARDETRRLHDRTGAARSGWFEGWADGDLAREKRGETEEASARRGPRTTIPAP